VDRRTKHYYKPGTWWDHVRASAYMSIPGLDAGRVTRELKLRLKFYCSWTWWFLIVFFFSFVCYIIMSFLFLFLFLFSFFFLYYQLHHHYLLIPILTPSLSLLLLCYNPLFCFPTTLSASSYLYSSPVFTALFHPPPTCHDTTHPSYTLTTCWPTYCTHFTQPQPPAIPDTALYTTPTEIHPNTHKGHKTQQPLHYFSHSPTPLPTSPLSATLISQISISSLINNNPPTPTVYR
jgi:hypothetical protein